MWTIGSLSIQNSALVGALIVDFIIQWVRASSLEATTLLQLSLHLVWLMNNTILQVGWGISAPLQTDKLYDGLGSTTFAALAIGTLTYAKYYYARQILATVLVIVWAARLGGFLVFRVIKTGRDSRFDEAKKQPCKIPGLAQCSHALCITGQRYKKDTVDTSVSSRPLATLPDGGCNLG